MTIGVQNFIQRSIEKLAVTNDLNATWIGSLASYWGGIIGGVNIYEINSKAINNDILEEKILYYRIRLRNIGQGFANTLDLYWKEFWRYSL